MLKRRRIVGSWAAKCYIHDRRPGAVEYTLVTILSASADRDQIVVVEEHGATRTFRPHSHTAWERRLWRRGDYHATWLEDLPGIKYRVLLKYGEDRRTIPDLIDFTPELAAEIAAKQAKRDHLKRRADRVDTVLDFIAGMNSDGIDEVEKFLKDLMRQQGARAHYLLQ